MNVVLETLNDYSLCVRSRAVPMFAFSWATLIGVLIASRASPQLLPLLVVLTIVASLTAAGYIFNDIADLEIDKINNISRPIAQGKVSKKEAMSLVALLIILGLALSAAMNLQTLLLSAIFLTVALLYSTPGIYLKRRFLAKQLAPAINGSVSNLIGGAVIGSAPPTLLYASTLFFVFAMAGSPIVDLADIRGDKEKGAKTFAVTFGPSFTVRLGVTIIVVFSVISFFAAPFLGLNMAAPVVITASALAFSWLSFSLLRRYQDPKFSKLAYKGMALLLMIMQLATLLGIL